MCWWSLLAFILMSLFFVMMLLFLLQKSNVKHIYESYDPVLLWFDAVNINVASFDVVEVLFDRFTEVRYQRFVVHMKNTIDQLNCFWNNTFNLLCNVSNESSLCGVCCAWFELVRHSIDLQKNVTRVKIWAVCQPRVVYYFTRWYLPSTSSLMSSLMLISDAL